MPKRYFPIAVLTGVLAAVALLSYLAPSTTEAVPTRILFENAGGKVIFNHVVHTRDYGVACEDCHHEAEAGDENPLDCGTCHGVDFSEQWVAEHTTSFDKELQCVTCHHVEFEKDYDWGHDMHIDSELAECRDCHHDEDIEPEPTNCADCHESEGDEDMPAFRDAVHIKCQSCHEDMFEEQYAGCGNCHGAVDQKEALKSGTLDTSFTKCSSCHTDKTVPELIPGRMGAFHGSCIGCHEEQDAGPYTEDQCAQCHFQ